MIAVFLGSLTLALFVLSLALVSDLDWSVWADRLSRFRKWLRVTFDQCVTERERRAVRYVGRFVWVWLLLIVAAKGW
jgi:uncharacterized membrane protein